MENKLREYAALLVQVGLNVQPGQTLVIASPVECAFLPGCVLLRPMMPAAGKW